MPQCFSAYIHIPFCKSKCNYCSFVSFANTKISTQKAYLQTLLEEIKFFYRKETLKTVYFGGGTPSLLDCGDLKTVLDSFCVDKNTEITIEINPETVDYQKLCDLRKAGFNRLSIGVQTFNDDILKNIGRIHSGKKAEETIKNAFDSGFENISADFIYGLPNQSLQVFCEDLNTALNLGVTHISLYGLKIEEGCAFYLNKPSNIADDDLQADMYLAAIELLEKSGFDHYEISNFAKKSNTRNFESKHNINYWNCGAYYGFGAAAHGYKKDGALRYANFSSLENYMADYRHRESQTILTKQQQLEESVFLGFRKGCGIDIERINQDFDIDFEKIYNRQLKKYLDSGHILKTQNGYKLSNEGFLLSNLILSDFI